MTPTVRSGRRRASGDHLQYEVLADAAPRHGRRALAGPSATAWPGPRTAPFVRSPAPGVVRPGAPGLALGLVIASAGVLLAAVAPSSATAPSDPATQEPASPHQGVAGRASSGTPQAAAITLSSVTAAPTSLVAFGFERAGAVTAGITSPADTVLPVAPPAVTAPLVVDAPPADAVPEVGVRDALGLPVAVAHVSSTFGYRVDPMTGRDSELHTGIDYAGACGTSVVAADDGTVSEAGWHAYGGGQRIVVDHGHGLRTTYNHLGAIGVESGRQVDRGEPIGAVGSTGNSTGCHLHFEVMVDDEKVDPEPWL